MDTIDKDKSEVENRNENPMMFPSAGMSSDWRFNTANITNSSIGLVSTDCQMPVFRGDLVGGSSCSSVSMAESFGPTLWDNSANPQNFRFCDPNAENSAITSNIVGINKDGPAALRSDVDRTLNMAWNPSNSMLKGGILLPNVTGMLPQTLSQFLADPAFIERAARFSSFNGGNFSDMVNPFSFPETMSLYSRGMGMMQGPQEVFPASGLKCVSSGQAQQNVISLGEGSRDASLSAEPMETERSPIKNERRSDSVARSHEEAKQGVGGPGNESDEAEFSGGGGRNEAEGNDGESSGKSRGSNKRKRTEQDAQIDQAKGSQQTGEATKNGPENQQKEDENPTSTVNKTAGKQGKQRSQASDPPKEEYIHVRARRGQATNSHSLAERVRREKISERMKFLQDLVPGCSKVTGKAVMLDEIINYVQSLQRQVEFLSMKLATVNPRMDYNIDGLLEKDFLRPRTVPSSSLTFSPDMPMAYPALHLSQPAITQAAFPGLESYSDVLRRAIGSHMPPISGGFKEAAQLPNAWDDELHNVVQMSYAATVPQDTEDEDGSLRPGHMKAER